MLTQARLKELLHYNPATGLFIRRDTPRRPGQRHLPGDVAGSLNKVLGYVAICVDGKSYYAHRLAWLYMTGEWPTEQIDHRDTNRANNRWKNLRLASSGQNKMNRPSRGNRTGVKGVYETVNGTFMAQVWAGGKNVYSHRFKTLPEAKAARERAAKLHHGEFARLT